MVYSASNGSQLHAKLYITTTWAVSRLLRVLLQADVCHAYHLVRRNGIPDENVILMSYNDAADSVDNPIRGTLYK